MKPKSLLCALVLMMSASALLTGCATGSSAPTPSPAVSLRIYQPRVLQLKAGQPVQTPAGTYVPQTDELWHSAQAYADLEAQLINATAALAQQRAR